MPRTVTTWILGLVGWGVSYALFLRWLLANRWDFWGGWVEAFTASDFATGLLSDLVTVTIMMVAVALWDRRRLGPKWTLAVLAALALSVSMSLTIYLVAINREREPELEEAGSQTP